MVPPFASPRQKQLIICSFIVSSLGDCGPKFSDGRPLLCYPRKAVRSNLLLEIVLAAEEFKEVMDVLSTCSYLGYFKGNSRVFEKYFKGLSSLWFGSPFCSM